MKYLLIVDKAAACMGVTKQLLSHGPGYIIISSAEMANEIRRLMPENERSEVEIRVTIPTSENA